MSARAQTVINISNRLPVTIDDSGEGEPRIVKSSGGLVAALEGLPDDRFNLKWIGWPGGGSDSDPDRQRKIVDKLQREHGCTPVFISQEQAEGHYEGFSNSSLWPLLHYMPSRFRYEPAWWEHYRDVNRLFADAVVDAMKQVDNRDETLIWIHDYQLFLLPAMLREALGNHARIGFFLHTPFPSYEIFRCNPKRDELIEGMLGADLLGFHTFGYLRHFRSTAQRTVGSEAEMTHVRHHGRATTLGIYPIGINAAKFDEQVRKPEHDAARARVRETFANKQIVLSVERMDYTKGILHRLEAIDLYLSNRSEEERNRIKFIFVSVPSREGVEAYQTLREDVEAQIGRLNGKHATLLNSPVHFIHGSVEFSDLAALYSVADVCLVTPLIDGMNLVAKEFIAAQTDDSSGNGVLILGEFAGAAEELFNALIVNPYDAAAVAQAIGGALSMSDNEKRRRMVAMRSRVMKFDAPWWARTFIDDLRETASAGKNDPPVVRSDDVSDARGRLAKAISAGQRVGLFLDYDGTLREIEREPWAATPHAGIHELLTRLQESHENVDVTIISGRTPGDLEAWLGSYKRLGLIAEHGASFRGPGATQWHDLDRVQSYSWRDDLIKLLKRYEDSTPGSFLEVKRTGVVWHYRMADVEFGSWKAKQLAEELAVVTANESVQVRAGNKIVEITPSNINKAAAVIRIIEDRDYAVLLCAGDDVTDESMFRANLKNAITIKIGHGDTAAQYRLPNPGAFRQFLLDAIGN